MVKSFGAVLVGGFLASQVVLGNPIDHMIQNVVDLGNSELIDVAGGPLSLPVDHSKVIYQNEMKEEVGVGVQGPETSIPITSSLPRTPSVPLVSPGMDENPISNSGNEMNVYIPGSSNNVLSSPIQPGPMGPVIPVVGSVGPVVPNPSNSAAGALPVNPKPGNDVGSANPQSPLSSPNKNDQNDEIVPQSLAQYTQVWDENYKKYHLSVQILSEPDPDEDEFSNPLLQHDNIRYSDKEPRSNDYDLNDEEEEELFEINLDNDENDDDDDNNHVHDYQRLNKIWKRDNELMSHHHQGNITGSTTKSNAHESNSSGNSLQPSMATLAITIAVAGAVYLLQ